MAIQIIGTIHTDYHGYCVSISKGGRFHAWPVGSNALEGDDKAASANSLGVLETLIDNRTKRAATKAKHVWDIEAYAITRTRVPELSDKRADVYHFNVATITYHGVSGVDGEPKWRIKGKPVNRKGDPTQVLTDEVWLNTDENWDALKRACVHMSQESEARAKAFREKPSAIRIRKAGYGRPTPERQDKQERDHALQLGKPFEDEPVE